MTECTKRPLIDMAVLEQIAPIIHTTAHPLRLRILDFLDSEGRPCTVGQITEACGVAQSFVSQQLRILKDQHILSCRRQGNFVFYEIARPTLLHLLKCIRTQTGGSD
jgi:ArsR family transcriptional regulator